MTMAFEAIQSLVTRTIARFPDRVAIECPQGKLTYAQLDEYADDVAAALREAGAGPGAMVPVLADDRRELVAALLGVLRIGGVVVPLDTNARARRLEQMLADSDAGWVLAGSGVSIQDGDDDAVTAVLAAGAPAAVRVDLATVAGSAARAPFEEHRPSPDDPCYLFFTSGSTGRPKGVLGRLGSVDHYIRWEVDLLGIDEHWRVSQLISPAFDAILRDVFVPLAAGGTICVPPAGTLLDAAALARWVDDERISLVHTVPSLFRRLLDNAPEDEDVYESLACVALSGEKVPPGEAARWFGQFGERTRLLNLYGPSETTMTKTYHFVTPADTGKPSVPVGKPLPGTEVVLLDGKGRPIADGAIGEIHLRTPHRSLGYYRQPEATAAVFVPDGRAGATADDVLYRTGDYGRILPDGDLEYLGRKDHQVKIGGVRVELGGVEALLREHPAVADAAVVLSEKDGTVPFLCAFVELAAPVDTAELREHLRERLPGGAVPSVIVPLDALPRTLSGKIDRKALPAPVPADPRPDVERVAPRTPTERAVGKIWAAVLPVTEVDVTTSFFDTGGTSLLVIELISRLGAEFGTAVSLREFLSAPTVAGVAELVETSLLTGDDDFDDLLGPADGTTGKGI
jgi:amino acid adenylation domain-containing protein